MKNWKCQKKKEFTDRETKSDRGKGGRMHKNSIKVNGWSAKQRNERTNDPELRYASSACFLCLFFHTFYPCFPNVLYWFVFSLVCSHPSSSSPMALLLLLSLSQKRGIRLRREGIWGSTKRYLIDREMRFSKGLANDFTVIVDPWYQPY